MAITTTNNSSSSHHPRCRCCNRSCTTSARSSDSGRSYLALLKLVAIIGILCCTVRKLLSPTSMNLKQWMMQASPIITAPPPATTTTNQLYKGNTLYTSLEEHKKTDGTNAVKSTNTDFGIIKSPYDNTKSLKVMLCNNPHVSTTHMVPQVKLVPSLAELFAPLLI